VANKVSNLKLVKKDTLEEVFIHDELVITGKYSHYGRRCTLEGTVKSKRGDTTMYRILIQDGVGYRTVSAEELGVRVVMR